MTCLVRPSMQGEGLGSEARRWAPEPRSSPLCILSAFSLQVLLPRSRSQQAWGQPRENPGRGERTLCVPTHRGLNVSGTP